MSDLSQKIEALLFLAGEAVPIAELVRLLASSDDDIQQGLTELTQVLANRGLTLVRTETHVQLTTHPNMAEYIQHFLQGEAESLSNAAAEALALIAYRGPISRQEVEAIRGVDSRRIIRQLRVRGLIHSTSQRGQFPLYSITPDFLQHLGLTERSELPQFAALSTDISLVVLKNS